MNHLAFSSGAVRSEARSMDLQDTPPTFDPDAIHNPSQETLNSSKVKIAVDVDIPPALPVHYASSTTSHSWPARMLKGISRKYPAPYSLIRATLLYLRGPTPPIPLPNPKPLLDRSYTTKYFSTSIHLEQKWMNKTKFVSSPILLVAFGIAYIISLSFLVRANWYLTPADAFVDCTDSFWLPHDGCGIDGQRCAPFVSEKPVQFRCPASCSSTPLANIRAVGAEEVVYKPLVVGGGDAERTYRGDSWVCVAATHAGIISHSKGGCGALQLTGSFTDFIGTKSYGIQSVSFPSIFPLSYRFLSTSTLENCNDLRKPALAFNILVTVSLFAILRPSPEVLFWSMVTIGHWHITFFSDTRGVPPPVSDAFGVFLPALFIAYAMWRCAFRHVLPFFNEAPLERTLLYLVPFWCGVLFNVITEDLPIDRLTPEDFKKPGAVTALIVLGLLVVAVVLNQARMIRKTGWLPTYLSYYALGGAVLLILSQLPGLSLRLHHYIIAIVLLPGTAFPTRLSAIYQAFLLGMFLNGESRWGFDSIVQTAAQLRRDAPLGSSLPTFLTNQSHSISPTNPTIQWESILASDTKDTEGWNGFSLIIDDVERYTGTALNYTLSYLDWSIPHFFRLAFQKNGNSGDFTRAATYWPNGTFVDPAPGPS